MSEDSLKPCPFCGGEAEIYTPAICMGDDDADVDWMRPVCKGCGIGGLVVRFRDHRRNSEDFMRAKANAIAAWNRRYTPPLDRYRHVRRGTIYTVIGFGELQMVSDLIADGSEMVIYQGEDGRYWVREESEFHDGRFVPVGEYPHEE